MAETHSRGADGAVAALRQRGSWARRICITGAVFGSFLVVATVGYHAIQESYTWLDAVYMTVITIATVGYREVGGELGKAGQLWTIFVILAGLVTGAALLSQIVAALVEGGLRNLLGRRQMQRRIAAASGHVIVCGYGHMGRAVAEDLRQARTDMVVVDTDPERVGEAEAAGALTVVGSAEDDATLLAAGIERASALVALLPQDAENVFLALTARGLNPSVRIIAAAREATSLDKLRKAGATRVICPQLIGARRIVDLLLRPAMVDFVERAHEDTELEMEQLTLEEGSWLAGRTLRDLALPPRIGAVVVAVRRADGTIRYTPEADTPLSAGDTLVLLGRAGAAREIGQLKVPGPGPAGPAGPTG